MPRSLNRLIEQLGIDTGYGPAIEPHLDESLSTLPAERLPFLRAERIVECRAFCHLEPSLEEPLLKAAVLIESSPALRLLIWHGHRRLFVHPESPSLAAWPAGFHELGDQSGLFYLLLGQSMVPLVRETHARAGVDGSVTRGTCRQIDGFEGYHRLGCDGRPGLLRNQLYWLRHYTAGRLFRLGRFEYMIKKLLPTDLRVFKHYRSGRVIVFMPPGRHLNADGFVVDADDPACTATTDFQEDNHRVRGWPASPDGAAWLRPLVLRCSAWRQILGPGDHVLDTHIPPGGGMTPPVCHDSLTRAFAFFDQDRPDRIQMVYCSSWIFNTQLEQHLPDSNLARFMRELYLFPVPSSGRDGLNFVFCRDYDDWSRAPQETRLQRFMIDRLKSGAGLRGGGMVFLREHLPMFGRQIYRRQLGPRAGKVEDVA